MNKFSAQAAAFTTALILALGIIITPVSVRAREVEIPVSSGVILNTTQAETAAQTAGPQVAAPSVLLMEASTGQVIFEKNADEQRSPASITKIMTLILIFDALEDGRIKLTDEVVTSAYAKSMGGSQVFLEAADIIGLNQKRTLVPVALYGTI